jgi:sugar/nucleoside kinase (ribokinase family)
MNIEYVTIGEITIDDTVLENGKVRMLQTGGGSVYSAFGVRVWNHRVGIHSVIGREYPAEYLRTMEAHNISTEGVHRIKGPGLRLWLLHEEDNKKQQIPRLQSGDFVQMDKVRPDPPRSYMAARGYHLAPASSEGQMRGRDVVRSARPEALISLDILTSPLVNVQPYLDGSALAGIDVFSPSIVETEDLWPGESLDDVFQRIADAGVRWIAIKMDVRGSAVHDAVSGATYRLPIYPAKTVDATGAGDAFSGGFLEGIVETGDVLEAGLRGTISASFAVEYWGAFGMLQVTREMAEERLEWLRTRVE